MKFINPYLKFLLAILLFTGRSFGGELKEFSSAHWEKTSDENGITTFQSENSESQLFAFKVVGLIDAPVGKIANILIDSSFDKEWAPDLEESRLIRQVSPTERIEYWGVKTSALTKNRDFVIHESVELDQPNHRLIFRFRSVEDPLAPLTDKVRGTIRAGAYILIPKAGGKKTYVEYMVDLDPKGSIAKWIVNAVQKNFPRQAFEGLKRLAARPTVRDFPKVNPELLKLLPH